MHYLFQKKIVLGITGSIAAYKSPDIVRRLREQGAEVRVIMTDNAKEFITPLTLQAVSGHPVHDNLFDLAAEAAMGHIELARWADAILIAPASADCLARLAQGQANDLLTAVSLARTAPVALAPAMNQMMWEKEVTQANLQQLRQSGMTIFGPGSGSQACGEYGLGRMLEPLELVTALEQLFAYQLLSGCHVLITAGPTQEPIDPIRYVTNRSSGKMGYALAQAALEAGASVTLISGPVSLTPPAKAHCIQVKTAHDMYQAVMAYASSCNMFIGVAAVSDYTIKNPASSKIAKTDHEITLSLSPTPDIIRHIASFTPRPFVVGFAAESNDVLARASRKRQDKNMDIIIANKVGPHEGMESDDNAVTVIGADGQEEFPLMSKTKLARHLIQCVAKYYRQYQQERIRSNDKIDRSYPATSESSSGDNS